MLTEFLPLHMVEIIRALPISLIDIPDQPVWGLTNDGEFSVKSAT